MELKETSLFFPLRKSHIDMENTFLWLFPICNIDNYESQWFLCHAVTTDTLYGMSHLHSPIGDVFWNLVLTDNYCSDSENIRAKFYSSVFPPQTQRSICKCMSKLLPFYLLRMLSLSCFLMIVFVHCDKILQNKNKNVPFSSAFSRRRIFSSVAIVSPIYIA